MKKLFLILLPVGFLVLAKKTLACGLLCWIIGGAIINNSINSNTDKQIEKKTKETISYEACHKFGAYIMYIKEIGKCVLKFDNKGRAVYSDGTRGWGYSCENYFLWNDDNDDSNEYFYKNCP